MMSVNSRSVLRPEYLEQNQFVTSGNASHDNVLHRRYNTNTAPVYASDGSFAIKRRPFRRFHHPYMVSDFQKSRICVIDPKRQSNGSTQEQGTMRLGIANVPSRTYASSPGSDANSNSSSYSVGCKFPPESVGSARHRRDSPRHKEDYGSSRSYTHGQAEQIRRSRESNTFALIDSQLSLPPLNQVRDMYLQTRSGSSAGNNSSAARTTKKVNLSVVHTVVRFRIKDYLRDAQEHLKRLLDSLFRTMYDNYDPRTRSSLASQLFGISRVPCSPDCQYCPELHQSGRTNHTNARSDSRHRLQSARISPFPHYTRPYSTSSSSLNTPVLSASDGPSDSHEFSPSHPSPEIVECEVLPSVDHWLASSVIEHPEQIAVSQEVGPSPPIDTLPENNAILEKPLLSYHMNYEFFDSKDEDHARLDSTTLRLVNEFDTADWSAENIDLGPFSAEPVDLHSLVVDPTADPLGIRVDESFFDPAYDPNDLISQLAIDKCPSLTSNSP